MEGVVWNPTPSLAGPPPPGSGSKSSLGYEIAKDMGIAILSTVTGVVTTFLINKLWKHFKDNRNTADENRDGSPPQNLPPATETEQHSNNPSAPLEIDPGDVGMGKEEV